MSIESILILLLIAAAAAGWAHHGKISLHAAAAAKRYLEQQNLQFLDQSAVLKRIQLGWRSPSGPFLKRTYEFEFTHRGDFRYTGSLTLHGRQIYAVDLPPIVETVSLH